MSERSKIHRLAQFKMVVEDACEVLDGLPMSSKERRNTKKRLRCVCTTACNSIQKSTRHEGHVDVELLASMETLENRLVCRFPRIQPEYTYH